MQNYKWGLSGLKSTIYVSFTIGKAQCTAVTQSYYGLDPKTKEKCCEIRKEFFKETSGTEKKCGQSEVGCKDENDCLGGYTCGQFQNSGKLDQFIYLPTYSVNYCEISSVYI